MSELIISWILKQIPLSFLYIKGKSLQFRLDDNPPSWMLEQIAFDLAPWIKREISSQLLEEGMNDSKYVVAPQLLRYQIRKGQVYIHSYKGLNWNRRVVSISRFFTHLNSSIKLPDCDFVSTLHDMSSHFISDSLKFPLFTFSKNQINDIGAILIPDFEAMDGFEKLSEETEQAAKIHPWNSKLSKVIWRGATTGGYYDFDNYKQLPRFQLVDVSKKYPQIVDAKFSQSCQINQKLESQLREDGYFGNSLKIDEHLRYKYQVLIDGNTCSYSRAYWQLRSNSLMFKTDSNEVQWYYKALKPFQHYLPLKSDSSDLVEKVEWAEEHPNEVREIIENANQFAITNLSRDYIYLYVYLLLQEYSKLGSQKLCL